ncbi:MAG: lipid-binding SYLF domain-containing protein [Pseudomonadota bacterium]
MRLIFLLFILTLIARPMPAQETTSTTSPAPPAPTREEVVLDDSIVALREILADPEIPAALPYIKQAKGLLIFPKLIKGGFFFFGGRGGRGLLVMRKDDQRWSQPVFVRIGGVTFGLQFGSQIAQSMVVIMTDRGLKAITDGGFTFGGDISASALTFGAGIGVQTEITSPSDMYMINRSEGLYIGGVLEGSRLVIDQEANDLYYATQTTVQDTITGLSYGNRKNQALFEMLP